MTRDEYIIVINTLRQLVDFVQISEPIEHRMGLWDIACHAYDECLAGNLRIRKSNHIAGIACSNLLGEEFSITAGDAYMNIYNWAKEYYADQQNA